MPVHGSAHRHTLISHFVEKEMRLEGAEHDDEAPVAKSRVSETCTWPKLRMVSEKPARSFHRSQKTLSHVPIRIDRIPLELPLNIGNEIVRLADVH